MMASAALQKRGKSRFGFTMPKPLLYLQLDSNYEHVLAWARKTYPKKDAIRHIRYFADPRADIKAANLREWERLLRDYDYGLKNFRSIQIDTTSELLDVRKLSEFGRNTQILQIYYGGFYADLRWMVKQALDSNCNVNFIHRLKKQYVGDAWQGDYELEGWRGIMFETQIFVEHNRTDEGEFVTTIKECAQDASLMGLNLKSSDDENDFVNLAQRVFPDSDEKEWL